MQDSGFTGAEQMTEENGMANFQDEESKELRNLEANAFMQLLQFAANHPAFSATECMEFCKANEISGYHAFYFIERECAQLPNNKDLSEVQRKELLDIEKQGIRYRLMGGNLLAYCDFVEMKTAHKAALDAQKTATKALKISIWTLAASIIFSIAQIVVSLNIAAKPITIDEVQLQRLERGKSLQSDKAPIE